MTRESTLTEKQCRKKLAELEAGYLMVRYVAPPSGIMEALQGWAVEVRTKDGVTFAGGDGRMRDDAEAMFRGDRKKWRKA